MYGLKSDPGADFFFLRNSRCGAERISVPAKNHGLLRSGISALAMTRIGADRIVRTNLLSRIMNGFARDCHGADRLSADSRRISADKYHERQQQRNNDDKQYEL